MIQSLSTSKAPKPLPHCRLGLTSNAALMKQENVSRMTKCGQSELSRMPGAPHGAIRFAHVRNRFQTINLLKTLNRHLPPFTKRRCLAAFCHIAALRMFRRPTTESLPRHFAIGCGEISSRGIGSRRIRYRLTSIVGISNLL